MSSHRVSRALYRCLLRAYPREFRCHFRADLEADFAEMLSTLGRRAAWSRVCRDWLQSVSSTRAHLRAKGRRARAIAYRGESRMGSLVFDFRHALIGLIKAPVFSLVTIVTLALGIGANSAIFSLVNAVLLRPVGFEDPGRLMLIHEALPESKVPRFGVSPADYVDILAYQQSFAAMGAYRYATPRALGNWRSRAGGGGSIDAAGAVDSRRRPRYSAASSATRTRPATRWRSSATAYGSGALPGGTPSALS